MPDPGFLMLLQHLNRPPPAITQIAPAELSNSSVAAYSKYVAAQEKELNAWIARGSPAALRTLAAGRKRRFRPSPWIFSRKWSIDLSWALRQEARQLARIDKRARRDERYLTGAERTAVPTLHRKLIQLGERFYNEGRDFAGFLRALRAEMDG